MQLRSLFVVGALALATFSAPLARAVRAAEGDTESKPGAAVDLTVKAPGANAVHLGARVDWDHAATILKSADDHEHAIEIAVRRSDDGEQVHVAVRYLLDGNTVMVEKDVRATLATPVRIASADGKAEVVFTIKAEPPRKRIEIDESNDPLGGL